MSLVVAGVGVAGGVLLSSMGNSGPDTSGVNDAARQNAQISQEQLDWAKQLYADQAPERTAAEQRAGAVSDAQLAAMQEATREAQQTSSFQNSTLRPLQQGIVDDANNFDTEGKREELAGLALGDVNQNFANARAQTERGMTRMGVNPSDGAFGASGTALTNAQALAGADAETKARSQAMTLAAAKKADAAAMLQGLPANAATQAGLAITSGNSSVSNAQQGLQAGLSGASQLGQGYQTAIYGNNSAGNLYGNIANINNAASQQNNGMYDAIGKGVGAYFAMSDKNAKKDKKPMKGGVALSAVMSMPVKSWKYKDGAAAGDKGQQHVGPMAQDVKAVMGERAAPGGKQIDLVSLNGVNMAATQDLAKRVIRLEHALKRKTA